MRLFNFLICGEKWLPQFILLIIYLAFALGNLAYWEGHGKNPITGDEPHYLVMSSGIVRYKSFEQTKPYRHEFRTEEICRLAPRDALPSPGNTHAVMGPHGLFNIHNIGLPLLLAVPFFLGKAVGAKVFMVLCSALIVILAWKFAALFSESRRNGFWAAVATAISLPFIPASNQIYPDLIAGLFALVGLYRLYTAGKPRPWLQDLVILASVAYLPWLQIKFAATALVILFAIGLRVYLHSKNLNKVFCIIIVTAISFSALAIYNHYAFENIFGPYQSGDLAKTKALEISKTSLMVLFGLFLDQNQGFFLQNPINFVGILALGWMYKRDRYNAIVWALVFLSLIVPNSAHPNWYGGASFSGRFEWAAATTFIVPSVYGIIKIGDNSKKLFIYAILGCIIFQIYLYYMYTIYGVNLYNKSSAVWFDTYSTYFYPIHAWLPMFYDSDWAFRYLPNYAWLILSLVLLIFGFVGGGGIRIPRPALALTLFILIAISGVMTYRPISETRYDAHDLLFQTGKVIDSELVAEPGKDAPGFLSYGPYAALGKGRYEVILTYSSKAPASVVVGHFGVSSEAGKKLFRQTVLQGTDNMEKDIKLVFSVKKKDESTFEFRTHWNGSADMRIRDILFKEH